MVRDADNLISAPAAVLNRKANPPLRSNELNSIPAVQDEEPQRQLLAAQRALYWKAKRWVGVQVICTTIIAIAITIFGERFDTIRPWAALAGLLILVMDTWAFEFKQRGLRRRAAKIQELFDCNVLELDWNDFLAGSRPLAEEILEYNAKYVERDPDYSRLGLPWYSPNVGGLQMCFARLVCQRSNIRWDSRLRRIYGAGGLALAFLGLLLLVSFALLTHQAPGGFMLSVASLSPILVWSVREFAKQRESAGNLDRLMEQLERTWASMKQAEPSEPECKHIARDLQDALFEHRQDSPVVFDFIYRFLWKKSEQEMGLTAEKMIEDVSEHIPLTENKNPKSLPDPQRRDSTMKE